MRRLALLTSALTGILAMLAAGAAAVGSLRGSDMFALDGFDCALPCWQGIVPGEARTGRARRLLDDSPFVVPGSARYNVPSIDYEDGGTLHWDLRDRSGLLKQATARVEGWVLVTFDVPGLDARLGDVVAELGAPTWVVARYVTGQESTRLVADVFYPGMRLVTWGEGYKHLSPALSVSRVYFGDRTDLPRSGGDDELSNMMRWKGFVAVGRYGIASPW